MRVDHAIKQRVRALSIFQSIHHRMRMAHQPWSRSQQEVHVLASVDIPDPARSALADDGVGIQVAEVPRGSTLAARSNSVGSAFPWGVIMGVVVFCFVGLR